MKKILLTLLLSLTCASILNAQTTAANFTATDCNSTSHTLHTELDNGKVIVLVWVMPCVSCINDAKGAYDAVQAFASSHPGQVLYYLIDDYGNASCATLNSWANQYGIGTNRTVFDNVGVPINEANYGGSGMPHVMVVGGGTAHTVFFNQLNGSNNQAAIQTAISQALTATTVVNVNSENVPVTVYPNPAKGDISVSYSLPRSSNVKIDVVSVTGSIVKTVSKEQSTGKHETNIDLSGVSNGVYFVRVRTEIGTTTRKITLNK
jgi:hypothetical protein